MGIPAPSDVPEVWSVVELGPGKLPPVAREGNAVVAVQPKANLDAKRKGGARKPTTTNTGRELAEVTVALHFTEAVWPDVEAALRVLQPGSGPHKITHPKTQLAGVFVVSIESYEGPDWDEYQRGTVTWHCKEWAPPPPPEAPTAAKTPAAPVANEGDAWPDVRLGGVSTAKKGVAQRFLEAAARAAAEARRP
jgi:hypothetical protein